MVDKNIVVVGGNSGIGKTLIQKLQNSGANVFVFARNSNSGFYTIEWDVTQDLPDLSSLPEVIHGLVYLPGTINLKPFHRLKIEEFQEDLNINLLGAIKITQALINNLKKAEPASLVYVSTVATKLGMPFHSSVAVSKSAIEGLAKSIAAEYAPKIRANVVAPSLTDTPLAGRLLSTDEKRAASDQRHPLKRVGKTEDISNAIYYLLSDESSWVTGQVLGVDGGMGSVKIV
jgi:NAD(P)-dependent dehydrogenase (short-subunit alcohol dehydrogenase family)